MKTLPKTPVKVGRRPTENRPGVWCRNFRVAPLRRNTLPCLGGMMVLSLIVAADASATLFTWTGGGTNSNVSNAANWQNGVAPTAGTITDYLFSSTTNALVNIDTNTGYDFSSITFDSSAPAYTIEGDGGVVQTGGYRFLYINSGTGSTTPAALIDNSSFNETFTADVSAANATSTLVISGTGTGTLTLANNRVSQTTTIHVERNVVLKGFTASTSAASVTLNIDAGATSGTMNTVEAGDSSVTPFILALQLGTSTTTNLGAANLQTDVASTTSATVTQATDASFTGTGGLTISGNYTVTGTNNVNIFLNNTGGVTLSGTTMQIGASTGNGLRTVTLQAGNGSTNTISSAISSSASTGGGSLTVEASSAGAAGTVILSGANAYVGTTTVGGATLQVGNTAALGNTANALAVNGGGTLNLAGFSPTVGALALGTSSSTAGSLISNSGSAATLTTTGVTVNGTNNVIGTGVTVAGAITQATGSGLTVNGTGGADALGGTGTLLTGTGTLGALTLNSGGTISPGAATGMLAASGLTWNGGSTLSFILSNSTANASTLLALSGALTKGTGTGFNVSLTGGTSTSTVYDLINFTGTTNFVNSDFTLTGPPGLSGSLEIVNDELEFVVSTVPEPQMWAQLAVFGLVCLVGYRRPLFVRRRSTV